MAMSLAGRISWFPGPYRLRWPLRPPTSQRLVKTDRGACTVEVTGGVGILGLKFHTLRIQQIEQSSCSFFVSDICKIGCSLAVERCLMELTVFLTRTCIPHQRIIDIFERQQDSLLVLSELRLSICLAGRNARLHSASIQEGPVDVECRKVRGADTIEARISVILHHAQQTLEIDSREEVGCVDANLLCRCMETFLRRINIRATANEICRRSGIDASRQVGKSLLNVELTDKSIRRLAAKHCEPMLVESDRG